MVCPIAPPRPPTAASSIEFAGKSQAAKNGNLPVRHAGPGIDGTVPRPVLAAVITSHGEAQRMIEHRPGPRSANGVRGLTGEFASLRRAVERVVGKFPIEVVENSSLEGQRLLVREIEAMLEANLRRPAPEISRISEGRNGE